MLGLGSSISRSGKVGPTIVRDGLVLKHGYAGGSVQPVSTGAASFNGMSDYIQLPDPFSYSKITVSAWIYLSEETSTASVIYESRDSGPDGFLFYVDTSEAIRIKAQDTSVAGTAGLPLNNWVHACFTYDSSAASSNIKLYENGVLVNTGSETDSVAITANAKLGGGVSTVSDYWFPGYICNAGVWDEVLTQPQIKSIMHKDYASLSDSEKTNLVSWWNLDSTITDTTVFDNHHGGGSELASNYLTGSWVGTGGWSTITGGVSNTTGENGNTRQSSIEFTDFVGSVYKLTYTVSNTTDDTDLKAKFGGGANQDIPGVNGTHSVYLVSDADVDNFQFVSTTAWAGEVTDISLQLVNGNTGTLS